MRNGNALESGRDVLMVQMQPRKSGEGLRTDFFLFLGGTILIYSAISVESCGNLGVSGSRAAADSSANKDKKVVLAAGGIFVLRNSYGEPTEINGREA